MQRNSALVGCCAVFPKVDALPGSQSQSTAKDGDAQMDTHERGTDVGWHVIVSFGGVDESRVGFWKQFAKESLEVLTDIRIGIFLNDQRG